MKAFFLLLILFAAIGCQPTGNSRCMECGKRFEIDGQNGSRDWRYGVRCPSCGHMAPAERFYANGAESWNKSP